MLSPKLCLVLVIVLLCHVPCGAQEGRNVPAWDEVYRGSGLAAAAFSPDGKLLAATHFGDARQPCGILLWKFGPKAKDVELLRALPTPSYFVRFLAFSPDGKTLASGGDAPGFNNNATEVKLWDVGSGKPKIVLKGPADTASGLAFTSDGALLVASYDGGVVKVWNPVSGSDIRTINSEGGNIFSMAVMPKTHRATLARCEGLLNFIDLDTGKPTGNMQTHKNHVTAVAYSPSGKTMASFSAGDGAIYTWDTATGKKRKTFPAVKTYLSPHPLAISQEGKLATVLGVVKSDGEATEAKLNTVKLWEEATGKEVRAYKGHEETVDAVAFSPDGKTLITGSRYNATMWDTKAASAKKN